MINTRAALVAACMIVATAGVAVAVPLQPSTPTSSSSHRPWGPLRPDAPDRLEQHSPTARTAFINASVHAPADSVVSGTVSAPGDRTVEGVEIRLIAETGEDGTWVGQVTTDAAGRFAFDDVAVQADTYVLRATDPEGRLVDRWSRPFALDDGNGQNLRLARAAVIEGTVLVDRVGELSPADGAFVTVAGDSTGLWDTTTGNDGTYRLGGIPAGHYTLVVQFEDSPNVERDVHLKTGSHTLGTTIVQAANHGDLAGRVVDSSGAAVASAYVTVYDADNGNEPIAETNSGADGTWSIIGMAYDGPVKIVASLPDGLPTWYDGAADFASATPIDVPSGQTLVIHMTR